jgi:hypothetical protein
LRQSTGAQTHLIGPFLDPSDGNTEKNALTINASDIRLAKASADPVAKNSGGATFKEAGNYYITLDATDTSTVGTLEINVHVAGALYVFKPCYVVTPAVYDAFYGASATGYITNAQVDVRQIVGAAVNTATAQLGVNTVSASAGAINRAALNADTGLQSIRSNTATAGAATTITLDAGASATNNFYNNDIILITGGTGAGQARFITGYVGSTKVATVATWATNPAAASTFAILPFDSVPGASVPTVGQISTAVWQDLLASSDFSTAASIGKLLHDDIDAAISSRMASGNVTVATNLDKTGYALTSAYDPAKTASQAGDIMKVSSGTGANQINLSSGAVAVASLAANSVTAAAIADGAIDRATFAADTGLQTIRSNTAAAGAATTITLDAGASATNSFYVNDMILITGGTGAGQAKFITAYVGATKIATVGTWATNPDNTSTFAILPFDVVPGASAPTVGQISTAVWQDLLASADFSTSASIGKLLHDNIDAAISSRLASGNVTVATNLDKTGYALTSAYDPAKTAAQAGDTMKVSQGTAAGQIDLVTGQVKVASLAANSVNASVIADGAIDRATFAADTGLQTVRSNTAQAGAATTITLDASASATDNFYSNDLLLITGGTGAGQAKFITSYVGSTKIATVATWVTNPDNTSTFAILPYDAIPGATAPTAAQVAATVWQDLLASSDFATASSVGKLLKDNIDVAISSRLASGGVTVTTNNDKTGYALTAAYDQAKTAAQAGDTMKVSQGTGVGQVDLTTGQVKVGTNNDKAGYSLSTAGNNSAADALLDRASGADETLRQAMRLIASALGGKTSGSGTSTIVFRDPADTKNVISCTVDVNGNRTTCTLTLN